MLRIAEPPVFRATARGLEIVRPYEARPRAKSQTECHDQPQPDADTVRQTWGSKSAVVRGRSALPRQTYGRAVAGTTSLTLEHADELAKPWPSARESPAAPDCALARQ